jgi:hypothetical protein
VYYLKSHTNTYSPWKEYPSGFRQVRGIPRMLGKPVIDSATIFYYRMFLTNPPAEYTVYSSILPLVRKLSLSIYGSLLYFPEKLEDLSVFPP